MYDSTIHKKTIVRQFKASDFQPGILHIPLADKDAAVDRALAIVSNGFPSADLHSSRLRGKDVYQHRSIEQALLIRHITENIRRVTGVRQGDRHAIVESLIRLCGQGVAFQVIKLDINAFYESVAVDDILRSLTEDAAFSRQSVHLLRSYFDQLEARGISGLPRGLSISATLAEYLMRSFDAIVARAVGVRFYSRFVDDILLVLDPDIDAEFIIGFARAQLPSGLQFKRIKTKTLKFPPYAKGRLIRVEGAFSFLGYHISVGSIKSQDRRLIRDVAVDIAPSKVRRTKLRLSKALLHYNNGGSFIDLLDRFKMITSNYTLIDYDTGQPRHAGIRYNYPLLDVNKSSGIQELDSFLVSAITNTHPSNRIKPRITAEQRKKLLGLSFKTGFEQNRFFSFNDADVQRIIQCWSHA